MSSSRRLVFVAVLALASFSLGVLAHDGDVHGGHGGDHSGHMEGMNMGSAPLAETSNSTIALEPYYFEYELHKVWLVMHIVTMLFAWVVVMPVGTIICRIPVVETPWTDLCSHHALHRWFPIPCTCADRPVSHKHHRCRPRYRLQWSHPGSVSGKLT